MSNTLFPDLRGLAWEYTLTPTFSTGIQQAASGREVRAAFWSAPLWKMSLTYEFLRDNSQHVDANGYSELEQLIGFFLDLAQLTRKPLDSTISGQPIGTGDGATTSFQLARNIAGASEEVQDPAGQSAIVYVNGVRKTEGTDYTIANGVVRFAAAPAAGATITADFQWLWRVRFAQDQIEFSNFMYLLWECRKVELVQVRS